MVSLLAPVRAVAQTEPFVEEAEAIELPESRTRAATEVAMQGTLLVVGDPGIPGGTSSGAFYSLSRAEDRWVYEATFTASDGAIGDAFATSIALDGETVLVGARGHGLNGGITDTPGAAYVFVRSSGGWVEQQKLTAPDGAIDDHFGEVVALSGDTAVVSAPGKPFDANENQGAIYVFVRSGTTWTFEEQIIAPSPQDGDFFGQNMAVDGDTLLVGANFRAVDGGLRQGVAFVYVRSGGAWQLHQTLTSPDGEASDQFGAEVVLDGDMAIVCAPLADYEQYGNHGAGYVFTRAGTTWTLEQKISTSYNDSSIQRIGGRAALEGNTVLLSAPAYHADRGGVFVFVRSGTTWSEQQELRPAALTENFGQRAALSGNLAVISAFNGVFSFERVPAPGVGSSDGGDGGAPLADASSDSDAASSGETPRGDSGDSGGCGCKIQQRSDSSNALVVLAAACVAARWRRRPKNR